MQNLIGRSEGKVEEVGYRSAGDVEHGLHTKSHLVSLLHRIGRNVQFLLGPDDQRFLAECEARETERQRERRRHGETHETGATDVTAEGGEHDIAFKERERGSLTPA